MRTKRIKLYKWEELSKQAKEKVLDQYSYIPEEKQGLVNYLKTLDREYLQDGTIFNN